MLFSVQFGAANAAARQRITPENLRLGGGLYFSFFALHLQESKNKPDRSTFVEVTIKIIVTHCMHQSIFYVFK